MCHIFLNWPIVIGEIFPKVLVSIKTNVGIETEREGYAEKPRAVEKTGGTGGMLDKSGGTCDGVIRLPDGMYDKSCGTGAMGSIPEI